jgi:hypothetical protein
VLQQIIEPHQNIAHFIYNINTVKQNASLQCKQFGAGLLSKQNI